MKLRYLSFSLWCLIACLAASPSVHAQEINWLNRPYIEVTGEFKQEVTPDQIFISIVINENDTKNKQYSVEKQEVEMVKVLEKLGIDVKENLSVSDFSSSFKHYWIKNSEIKTSKNYILKVDNATLAGRVFQQLEAIGISNLNIDHIDHSNIESIRNEVKIKAVQNAKKKAEMLCEAIDQKVGKALYIRENTQNVYYPTMLRAKANGSAMMEDAIAFDSAPELEFEKIKVEYNIHVCFELLGAGWFGN